MTNNADIKNVDMLENKGISRRSFCKGGLAVALPFASGSIAASVGQRTLSESQNSNDVVMMSAIELSYAIRSGAVSCREVMEAYLSRIDSVNPTYNAIVSLRDQDVLIQEAEKCDSEISNGVYRGWMHGFPHAAKDLTDVKGIRTTKGSPIFETYIPDHDSITVERLKQAGAIIIGKTNVPELGLGSQTYNPVFGATLNAYDAKSTAGGSSGGAAAALALQLVPVADGSDMMGSLRNPAAFNNVIGFRPTLGRVPLGSNFMQQLACIGPMGRTVKDTAMLLSIMAGYDSSSPLSLTQDPSVFAGPLGKEFKGAKIGWLGDFGGYLTMEQGILELCQQSLGNFEEFGCVVENAKVDYPMEKLWDTWLTHRHWVCAGAGQSLYSDPKTRKQLKPELIWEIEGGLNITGRDLYQASVARSEWYDAVHRAFDEYDFLVLPTAQVFPFDAKTYWPREIAGRSMDTYHRWMEVVVPGTLSGCPTINVPAGFGTSGLPMGMQILGPMHRDLDVLKIAYAYEQVAGWNRSTPPWSTFEGLP